MWSVWIRRPGPDVAIVLSASLAMARPASRASPAPTLCAIRKSILKFILVCYPCVLSVCVRGISAVRGVFNGVKGVATASMLIVFVMLRLRGLEKRRHPNACASDCAIICILHFAFGLNGNLMLFMV